MEEYDGPTPLDFDNGDDGEKTHGSVFVLVAEFRRPCGRAVVVRAGATKVAKAEIAILAILKRNASAAVAVAVLVVGGGCIFDMTFALFKRLERSLILMHSRTAPVSE